MGKFKDFLEEVRKSGQTGPAKMGDEVKSNNKDITKLFTVYNKKTAKKNTYSFVENEPYKLKHWPLVYVYNPDTGNVTYGSEGLWARQEIVSRSKAFHKDKPEKIALGLEGSAYKNNDMSTAESVILKHYNKYKGK